MAYSQPPIKKKDGNYEENKKYNEEKNRDGI